MNFKPKVANKSEQLASKHRYRVAMKLGMKPNEVDVNALDRGDFLRAEGEFVAK